MGSSTKKKKDKRKDFQKPKLKIGKARPRATNATDTSFKSKAITLNQQSLTLAAPSTSSQFSHHLSLLNSHSDNQRRDSLSYLTSTIAGRRVDMPLEQPVNVLLPKLLPLIVDGSRGVRDQLIKLLGVLPPSDIEAHSEKLLIYIRAGMTHLAADIRASSMDVLAWALDVAGDAIVSAAGGWVKTLNYFLTMLGWPKEEVNVSWSKPDASFNKGVDGGKALAKTLSVLGSFLRCGLAESDENNAEEMISFPLVDVQYHLLPRKSNCFAHLNLFASPRTDENEIYEDREERQKVFCEVFQRAVERGLEVAQREGGEVGRSAAAVKGFLTQALIQSAQKEA